MHVTTASAQDEMQTCFSSGLSSELCYRTQFGCALRKWLIVKLISADASVYLHCGISLFAFRVGQTLNVYWEKTPESVLYDAVRKAVDSLEGVQLIDYTSTEDIFVPQLAGNFIVVSIGGGGRGTCRRWQHRCHVGGGVCIGLYNMSSRMRRWCTAGTDQCILGMTARKVNYFSA